MFTYVNMKNFMSFRDTSFDFRKGKDAKRFISIYGENGSGKSNFVTCIDLLRKSIESFDMASTAEDIMTAAKGAEVPGFLVDFFDSINLSKYRNNCRMIGSEEPTTIEYGFQIGDKQGSYKVSFSEKIVYEKLYYFTGKQRGILYELEYADEKIKMEFSKKLFRNKTVEKEIREEISKYWGKHSLLSIFQKEREDKNAEYIRESYLQSVYDLIDMLDDTTVPCEGSAIAGIEFSSDKPRNILKNLDKGRTKKQNESMLDRSERILRDFITQTYADIKDAYYKRVVEDEAIAYELYVQKMIGGEVRAIPFSKESAGTRRILEIIRSTLGAFCGATVVYDEIDNGIHDLLLKNILESMIDDITGQLIITTHNTYMLESIDAKAVYVINVDYRGEKEAKCLDKFQRIQGTNNPRLMYLKGLFGGVPIVDSVDYNSIVQEITDEAEGGK